jgi:hypothetical protein
MGDRDETRGADRVVVCDTEVMADGPRRVVERASMRSEQGPVGLQGVVRIELALRFTPRSLRNR